MTGPAPGCRPWYRTFPAIAGFAVLAAVVMASGVIAVVLFGRVESRRIFGQSESVGLVAHLPAPDADLTAELDAAATDAHDAAHMCLAVLKQTLNNYDAEFSTHIDQADRHLKAAVAIVNRSLTQPSRSSPRG
ncbi:hypothetical protein ACTWP6_21210 [Mycobacterium sp. 4D054]|uniref:hypothetical protein n=1 Tax=unclassified Mycobacterium TaxID=2642494 RepID=UPI0021B313FF|nr:hypothetical protein [Mycobacterium sp. SMC-8]UXA14729.1 hypothetical protein KXD97_13725 [Mycobacterium sp. SMC-8]